MKFLIYCVFTKSYNKLILYWIENTAKRFYPGKTDILVITDDKTFKENSLLIEYIESKNSLDDELYAKFERHLQILEKYKNKYDIFVAFQSNCFISKILNEDNFPIDKEKLTVFAHSLICADKISGNDLVLSSCPKIGSCAYRNPSLYNNLYIHAGMSIACYEVMKKMNEDCYEMYLNDLKNNMLNKIPYHDESLINTWKVDNENLVNVLYDLNYGSLKTIKKCNTTFFLANKGDFGINKNYDKCIVPLFLKGSRLCNHMFVLATAYAHSLKIGGKCKVPYHLDESTLKLKKVSGIIFENTPKTLDIVNNSVYAEKTYHYNEIPATVDGGFLMGFFQSSKYFKNYEKEIFELFSPLVEYPKGDYAAIHIRLTDYVEKQNHHKIMNKEFIIKALSLLSDDITDLKIFSDDVEGAKQIMSEINCKFNIIYDQSNDIEALKQLTAAKELIMSCSSFSWWAAYLGKPRKVIVDKEWFADDGFDYKDVYEKNWIKI